MLVAKCYLEGRDVRMSDDNGSVRLVPAAGPLDTFDGEGERTPQVRQQGNLRYYISAF